jgi:hypothetical protein
LSDLGLNYSDYYSKWREVIPHRRSRRQYDARKTIHPDVVANLRQCCDEFRPYSGAWAVVVTESPDEVFSGVIGAYGKVKNARAFMAFIGDMRQPHVHEAIGYTGEGVILEATALGLNTCWIGGFFRAEVVSTLIELQPNESVLSVTPVGYASTLATLEEKTMTGFGLTHRRKSLASLAGGLPQIDWSEWVLPSLEGARLAPSAVNRQPWGFQVEPDGIKVHVRGGGLETKISKRLDCGIAMLHLEVMAHGLGVAGSWEYLAAPDVARFRIRHDARS